MPKSDGHDEQPQPGAGMARIQLAKKTHTSRIDRLEPVLRGLLLVTALAPAGLTSADPVPFNWRLHSGDMQPIDDAAAPQTAPDESPNPVVLPKPEAAPQEEEESGAGWHWLRPKIAGSPGSTSDRTAVQLANQEQDQAMAARNSPLNSVLPGNLSGLAPMGVESGIEWRF